MREKLVAVKRIQADVDSLRSRVGDLEDTRRELERQCRHLQAILDETGCEFPWMPWTFGQPAPADPTGAAGRVPARETFLS